MPEAPEVQTVLSTLEHQIKGAKILDVKVYYPKLIQNLDVTEFVVEKKTTTASLTMRISTSTSAAIYLSLPLSNPKNKL